MCCIYLLMVFLHFVYSAGLMSNKTDDSLDLFFHYDESQSDYPTRGNPCSLRLHSSLEKLRKRQTPVTTSGFIDLTGYALHQTLRRAPFDMYVTDIKVRTPGTGNWARVERCQFSNSENRLVANLLFNDLAVTGNVRLFEENTFLKNPGQSVPLEFCSMTVRLKRAGLGINAFPTRGRSKGIDVRTEARFVDPNYLSVHAYGCKLDQVLNKNDFRKIFGERESPHINHRYLETQIQQKNRVKHLMDDIEKSNVQFENDGIQTPGVRIITLMPNIPSKEESLSTLQLHREDETDVNNYHKERILSAKFQKERDKLKAVLHVKNVIAQQANQVFQVHGPFSQFQSIPKPVQDQNMQETQKFHHVQPMSVISTITELDENFSPVRPILPGSEDAFFSVSNDKIVNGNNHEFQTETEELTREMEDMFLRGIKTLLTKYLEKQLEIPLKEALMNEIAEECEGAKERCGTSVEFTMFWIERCTSLQTKNIQQYQRIFRHDN